MRELKGCNGLDERGRRDGTARGGRRAEMTAPWDTHRQMGWPAGSSGRLTLDQTRSARQGRHPPHSTFSGSGRAQVMPSREQAQGAGKAGPAEAGAGWRCVQVRSQADAGVVTGGEAGAEVSMGRPPDLRRRFGTRPSGGGGGRAEEMGRQAGRRSHHQRKSRTLTAVSLLQSPDLSQDQAR